MEYSRAFSCEGLYGVGGESAREYCEVIFQARLAGQMTPSNVHFRADKVFGRPLRSLRTFRSLNNRVVVLECYSRQASINVLVGPALVPITTVGDYGCGPLTPTQ